MQDSPASLLGPQGPFARLLPGFHPRPVQQQLAEEVAAAIADAGTLVCEAGTGTGKTFAYLVPALLSGKRIIISTGTKNLQDQLFHRDLPVVREALCAPVQAALLKGRANYLCLHRLHQVIAAGVGTTGRQAELQTIQTWAGRTESGDIAELAEVPEDAAIWPLVTSTVENCLRQECPLYEDCHVVKARREAQAAEVVVVNHHLFLADLALREQGFGEVLPGAEAVIFDEAHQLPEIASQFFGTVFSSRQLSELGRDTLRSQIGEAADTPALRDIASHLERAVRDLRLAMDGRERGYWQEQTLKPAVTGALQQLQAALLGLVEGLARVAERGPSLANCHRRAGALREQLETYATQEAPGIIRWYETHRRGFVLYQTPLEVAELFNERMSRHRGARIYTSATLAVGEDFSYFTRQLGLAGAEERRFDSPFDYAHQGLIYLPSIEVDPRSANYTRAVVETAMPVLQASGGRAFLLFTSHRALNTASELLRGKDAGFSLWVQGQAPRAQLLEQFRHAERAVLLGTSSFWEGVDVRGDALSCVVIDKLPFAALDDPVMRARMRAMEERGGNPFVEYQIPEAVIALKQGVGRLIRDVRDWGVVVLCDPRLTEKSYGKKFMAALPPMPLTHELSDVQAFFANPKISG
ncbi:MAG TPA: ATP-dependent DNA helicase [Gammaproteobacteria bacterium]|nr:ATP-dependent DNA helicase [Gammaproteobacteria bacterium]